MLLLATLIYTVSSNNKFDLFKNNAVSPNQATPPEQLTSLQEPDQQRERTRRDTQENLMDLPVFNNSDSFTAPVNNHQTGRLAMANSEDNYYTMSQHCNGILRTLVPYSHIMKYGSYAAVPRICSRSMYRLVTSAHGNCCYKVFRNYYYRGPYEIIRPSDGTKLHERIRSLMVTRCQN